MTCTATPHHCIKPVAVCAHLCTAEAPRRTHDVWRTLHTAAMLCTCHKPTLLAVPSPMHPTLHCTGATKTVTSVTLGLRSHAVRLPPADHRNPGPVLSWPTCGSSLALMARPACPHPPGASTQQGWSVPLLI